MNIPLPIQMFGLVLAKRLVNARDKAEEFSKACDFGRGVRFRSIKPQRKQRFPKIFGAWMQCKSLDEGFIRFVVLIVLS